MTETKTRKKPKRTKLRAVQKMFYDNRIVVEGEVFVFTGDKLPSEEIAVPVAADVGLGVVVAPDVPPKDAPQWTTKGYVDQANREAGRQDDEADPEA